MNITRRELLQQTGWGLLTLAISQGTVNRHLAALAAPNPRKLALLVGIDQYGANIPPLPGCLTDVELQKDLLRYRFGFRDADIVTLTGQKASREAIELAFLEHLIAQAKPGDVVIFHFSGYGSVGEGKEVFIPSNGTENALIKENILLLARCLATDKFSLIFDSSHLPQNRPYLGNLKIRSYPSSVANLNPTELTFAADIKTRFNLKNKPNNGVVFSAAQPEQIALELSGNSPNAGLFTYDLTQYLWQACPSPTIAIAFPRLRNLVASHSSEQQQPAILTSNQKNNSAPTYHTTSETSRGGAAIVTNLIDERTLEVNLVGLPLEILENYGINSCLSFIEATGEEISLQILSRQGLKAKAQLLSATASLEIGQILQEKLRVFPNKIGLIVGLDNNLTRIERVDATSTFASLPDVAAVVNIGEQTVDCLLSRVDSEETGNYQLLSANGSLIIGSLGAANEAIKSGIKRLQSQLETLLACKLWHLLLNQESSGLAVIVTLESLDQTYISTVQTQKIAGSRGASIPKNDLILPVGTEIRYQIENQEEQPLYALILVLNSDRQPLLYCSRSENPDNFSNSSQLAPFVVAAKTKATIPNDRQGHWKISQPKGITENLLILSRHPFPKTFTILNATQSVKGEASQLLTLTNPLEIARAFGRDLKLDLGLKMDNSGSVIDEYAFDLGTWSGFRFIYQVMD
ncbi:MAG: caspase family protein [Microcystis viridis Mv_BB_P_19951000_S69]|uniref:Caspase family protein n=1 Tax=Microcystis viridis Mv_BB_P_19951000_S68D TaxID=2486270 RepID=A0A552H873_MICVR|nr:MAG: caspase family protein [Microcystis viridis Mv_BB_P_19951000_S68D]TRU71228.1 MAG: caspase family protein [Microcystis viridis Mv_BB_P_19951000_S68]TRU78874.1 MAG: caspase family protein [Microcystis viridis Mv_BB_P_19951000_S69]TRU85909.1 MAG: caspase family protein [Microcystis viridis Mv_BB_P_19951000_S69D]